MIRHILRWQAACAMVIAIALCTLAGCAGAPVRPVPDVHTVTVQVPVTVTCVTASQIPVEPAAVGGKLTGNAVTDADILAAADIRLRAWGRELRALLSGCVAPGK